MPVHDSTPQRPTDRQLVRLALSAAAAWEDSLAASYGNMPNDPVRIDALRKAAWYRDLLKRRYKVKAL